VETATDLVDEAQLVRALRQRDEAAFVEVTESYFSSMLRVAQIYVSSRAAAEEVVQDAWVGVLNGIDRFEGRSSLKTWVFRILTNTAKTRAVRESRVIPFSALQDPGRVPEPAVDADRFLDSEHPRWPGHWTSPPSGWAAVPEEQLLGKETRELVGLAVERLPANQRAVISLRDIEGWDAEDVCNVLGVSETNQRVLLHRARSKVRRELESYFEEVSA
jgi:RNA polymerase sigma-70 factor (ECF subfamily)